MADSNSTTTFIDQLNYLRSILRSDDHLHIQPSGDYEQVRIKLDHDIQLGFFFDSLDSLNKSLTVNNVTDLRMNKSSNKCPLSNAEWTTIRKYFDELIRKSNKSTSVESIIQSIQDHLLKLTITSQKSKQTDKTLDDVTPAEDMSSPGNKFRGTISIFNRILHDKTIDRSQVMLGYEDRFTGIHEMPFNEFKRVENHETGVPMHRVRYFKINGNIVWDRTKKIDLLTGSDQPNGAPIENNPSSNLAQGLYRFDPSLQQWVECPHISLASDDTKIPSTKETCLPERCHFLSWNILSDNYQTESIHTCQRHHTLLYTLKTLLPDVICLQDVTVSFLNLLLNELWLQENNYYIVIMKSVINSEQNKSCGQMILTKNFRPRSLTMCPLHVSGDAETTKEIIMARFGLSPKITIDLANLHLFSDHCDNVEEKRCQTLENIFNKMKTNNYMLIGDFNFGDYNLKEQDILEKYQDEVHDLWKDIYHIDQNPGYTFDPSSNLCARITSTSQIKLRSDRYLMRTLDTLSYSIEHLAIIGTETIPINPFDDDDFQRIHQSDHYALQLVMNFRTRSISHRSALAILPTLNTWPLIDPYRQQYDPSFDRWPPHINLLWPFFDLTDCEEDQENILLQLRLLLCQYESFSAGIDQIDSFVENKTIYMKLNQQSENHVKKLHAQLIKLFPQLSGNHKNRYNPSMTIGYFDTDEKFKQAKSSLILNESFQFPVHYVYILQRSLDNDTEPFHIAYQLPLGSVLPPINSKQLHSVDEKLQQFFQTMNLYESEQSYQRKQEKFEKLSSCFEQIFNNDTLHCFTHSFLPYGSFRIGINGQDVDTVFILNEIKCDDNQATSFDEALRELKHDPTGLNDHIVDLLETQINGTMKNEILHYRKIQALFPIISIVFHDQTKVEIFVQIKIIKEQSNVQICQDDFEGEESIHGEFFSLVQQFFSTFAHFNWLGDTVRLYPKTYKQKSLSDKLLAYHRGSMRIISPSAPFNNTGRSTSNSTRDLISEGFERVLELIDTINTITLDDKSNALRQILELTNRFPNEKMKSILQLTLSSDSTDELHAWTGWMQLRLAHFLNDCEEECHLSIQTQSSIEYRSKNTEAFYSIGFQVDPQSLNQHRYFSYWLKQFLDQFNLFPQRTESMKVSHKIICIHDWKLERMQPKPQRIRK
ncbi:unnamed protein product [Rotaria socialis]|uniref:MJ1316 RNA cyclic group end recognition domain-containing protein n=2 Tax=Rotaria socialis TaxID=392032 RepID=A0A818CGZ4_9BILA|nr:unnamed protein product [Rotaria socialis]